MMFSLDFIWSSKIWLRSCFGFEIVEQSRYSNNDLVQQYPITKKAKEICSLNAHFRRFMTALLKNSIALLLQNQNCLIGIESIIQEV